MADSIDIPYANGMDYGMGVNFRDGSVAGLAVDPGAPKAAPTNADGQTVRYDLSVINTFDDLYKSLGIDVSASGQYALFKASAKFDYANETKFNSQSTFVVAHCVVENAFAQIENARIVEGSDAYDLLKAGNITLFQQKYGDGFVRGFQTGGEFFAVISITSSTREEQESIAAGLTASYGGLFASVAVDFKLSDQMKSQMSKSEIHVSTYQRGGTGDQTSITSDVASVMARLKAFPAQVQANPVAYSAQLARYITIPLPAGPNPLDIEAQSQALREYAADQLLIRTKRNDLEFVQLHPDFFASPPSEDELNDWQTFFTTEESVLLRQASRCSDDATMCTPLPFTVPPGYAPIVRSVTNAVDAFAAANSFPDNIFIRTVSLSAPPDFEVTTRLTTNFQNVKAPGGYFGVGLALIADDLNPKRAIWFLKGVGDTGPSVSCYAFNSAWDNSVKPLGDTLAIYPDDEVLLRIARKGTTVTELSFSLDGQDWRQLAKFINLADIGIPDTSNTRLVFAAYSTTGDPVSGIFSDTNIVAI